MSQSSEFVITEATGTAGLRVRNGQFGGGRVRGRDDEIRGLACGYIVDGCDKKGVDGNRNVEKVVGVVENGAIEFKRGIERDDECKEGVQSAPIQSSVIQSSDHIGREWEQ